MISPRLFVRIVSVCCGLLAVSSRADAQAPVARLTNGQTTLVVSAAGVALESSNAEFPAIKGAAGLLWSLTLQTPSLPSAPGTRRTVRSSEQQLRITEDAGGISVVADALTEGGQRWDVRVTLQFSREGTGFRLTGEIDNRAEGWIVRDLRCPTLSGIEARPQSHPLLWPNGLGQRFTDGVEFGERTFNYPSGRATMPWLAFAGAKGGLYVGVHDPLQGAREFSARFERTTNAYQLAITHPVFCEPGRRWPLPPAILLPYQGSWHVAAKHYRTWFDSNRPVAAAPRWARDSAGWLLAILKQQNGDVMWDYSALDQLCDVADQRGLDILGLFGWAHGGHDRFYPDYIPDPLMGGRDTLKRALSRAKQRGKRVILYANGQLIDSATHFYRYEGNDAIVLREDSEAVTSSIRKFNSSTPVTFVQGCSAAPVWERRMLDLAVQAHELGADGIIYDQLGVIGPALCFAKHHNHATPATAFSVGRRELVARIAAHMKQIAPDFVVMTEGVHDSLIDSTPFSHGWGVGFTPAPAEFYEGGKGVDPTRGTTWPWMRDTFTAFPEMFRITFPEVLLTLRHATPMMDRHFANYSLTYGLRPEIETRWQADVAYLKQGRVPTAESYADCTYWPPDIGMMQATPPAEATRYLKQVTAFSRRHGALLLSGKFVDTEGFAFSGEGLIAKGYRHGKQLGVLVWNPTSRAIPAKLDVQGGAFIAASEPEHERVEPDTPVAGRSVRLYLYDL